jgi:hypothetical protein
MFKIENKSKNRTWIVMLIAMFACAFMLAGSAWAEVDNEFNETVVASAPELIIAANGGGTCSCASNELGTCHLITHSCDQGYVPVCTGPDSDGLCGCYCKHKKQ